jgi:hypothetical protein
MTDSDQQRAVERPWWRPRWYELAPELVLVAGLTGFLVDEPDAATSAFKSSRAVVLVGLAAAGWIAGRVALARFVPWPAARAAVFALAAVGVLAVVVLPAYDNDTVVEAFPVAPASDASAGTIATTPPPPTTPATTVPVAADATTPDIEPATSAPPTSAPPTAPPNEPVRLRTAQFMGIDHRASGTVSIYRAPDGRHVVGLEEFDIQPGPDYDVYVVPGTDRQDPDGGVRLDDLRGNRGTQYYEAPSDVDVGGGEWTVLIWCQTFGVPVANATPT